MKPSLRDHRAVQCVQKILVEQPVVVVPFLRPRVREQNVVRRNGVRRDQVRDRVERLHPHQAHVGQTQPTRLVVHLADAPQHPVDPEKVGPGVLGRPREQEPPLAAAHIDFERARHVEERLEPDWLEPILREDPQAGQFGLHGLQGFYPKFPTTFNIER